MYLGAIRTRWHYHEDIPVFFTPTSFLEESLHESDWPAFLSDWLLKTPA